MSDDSFVVELAGRRWTLPHLPFRAIMSIQPALFQIYEEAGGGAASTQGAVALGEAQIERLAQAIWRAINHVEPQLSYDDFTALPFSVGDLLSAFPAVARASGLRPHAGPATVEASPPPGKSISTP